MPVEVSYLVASIFLYIAMVIVQAIFANLNHSPKVLLGARDDLQDRSVMVLRAKRANHNMVEALLMFVPLMLVAIHFTRLNDMTALGAMLFFFGRLAYAPLYWMGIPVVRSLAWFVAFTGIVFIAWQVMPFSGAV